MAPLVLPEGHADSVLVVSMSGGKDSTATALRVIESGLSARFVFADTGWEAQETYDYLDMLRARLGITIDVVGKPGGMRAAIAGGARFPSRVQKWCTRELKIEPLRAYHDRVAAEVGADTINVVGVRGEESESRAKMPEWEYSDEWGGYVWRPIIHLLIGEVLAIHHRHGIPVNPLYQRGHSRVGCYPCIQANKEEIEIIAKHSPERIDEIEALEIGGSAERVRRNLETPGRYAGEVATFFQQIEAVMGDDGKPVLLENGKPKRRGAPFPIRDAVAWSRTSRGGVQLRMLDTAPSGGCFRWGLCEPPAKDGAA